MSSFAILITANINFLSLAKYFAPLPFREREGIEMNISRCCSPLPGLVPCQSGRANANVKFRSEIDERIQDDIASLLLVRREH